MKQRSPSPWLLVLLIILAIFIFNQFNGAANSTAIGYSQFITFVKDGNVSSVTIQNDSIRGKLTGPQQVQNTNGKPVAVEQFSTIAPRGSLGDNLYKLLDANNVEVRGQRPSQWGGVLLSFLPIIILIAFFWFIFMRAQGGPSQVMQFGQSRAKTYGRENKIDTTFDDVAGHEEAKQELKEVVDFLKNPKKYHEIGAEIPKGVLLVGPPGTGKTLLARAVAGEASVPFLTVSASEFMEMFVGVGASRVRNLFEEARKANPAIIFIDELDSIGRRRGTGIGGGHDEREQTLNQILTEMDGFEKDTSVIVVAATNRPDILDPALLRPGRFDRRVTIGLPTLSERKDILKVHVRKKPISDEVSLDRLAAATPMFSGADLENLTNEAALIAARQDKKIISWKDFNDALDRIIIGLRKGARSVSPEEKNILAYHEAGHAVVQVATKETGDIRKVTIMPQGGAGGFMAPLFPEKLVDNRQALEEQIMIAFGGRVSEKKLTGTISTGASNDLKQATDIAKQMVFNYGMGDSEFVAWGSNQAPVFLGGEISRRKDFSEETARQLENEINTLLETQYKQTEALLHAKWDTVVAVATILLEHETIDGKHVHKAFELGEEGKSVEEITNTIGGDIAHANEEAEKESQRADEEAKQRAERKQCDAERDSEKEQGQRKTPLAPRPADS